ncbi:MAG: SCP2 sterol-binding domain-containing protein [Saccharospirillum sp.]|nr:SCP2 sterol-binding domain-containing protein [Saccharospirillum sp.]
MQHLPFLNSPAIHNGLQKILWKAASKAPCSLANPLIEVILNRSLKRPLANGELVFMKDRLLTLEIIDLDRSLNIELVDNRLKCELADNQGDVTFKGKVAGFVALALKTQDPDTLFFNRSLSIRGDTELGLEIKNFIDRQDLTDSLDPPLLQALHLLETVTQRSNECAARSR